jgi:hypothetical protein
VVEFLEKMLVSEKEKNPTAFRHAASHLMEHTRGLSSYNISPKEKKEKELLTVGHQSQSRVDFGLSLLFSQRRTRRKMRKPMKTENNCGTLSQGCAKR